MTAEEFQALALRLGAVEMHPILDTIRFRVADRTFATLGWPERGWAVVQLSASAQAAVLASSNAFASDGGRRGERGVTLIRLDRVDAPMLAEVLADAWREAYRSRDVIAAGAATTSARV
ncbi:hypothetical protein [Brevundimonas vesicularis]|uniref:hypothetical protein n=1 Tax=Brevundimonas vesicularis TaxID=41276 RepID=UPI00384EB50D